MSHDSQWLGMLKDVGDNSLEYIGCVGKLCVRLLILINLETIMATQS